MLKSILVQISLDKEVRMVFGCFYNFLDTIITWLDEDQGIDLALSF